MLKRLSMPKIADLPEEVAGMVDLKDREDDDQVKCHLVLSSQEIQLFPRELLGTSKDGRLLVWKSLITGRPVLQGVVNLDKSVEDDQMNVDDLHEHDDIGQIHSMALTVEKADADTEEMEILEKVVAVENEEDKPTNT